MINEFLKEVCEELKQIDIDYIVVGGSAIENEGYSIGTTDLDFVLTPKGFDRVEKRLENSSRFKIRDKIKTMLETGFMFENTWQTVEFIDPATFSGDKGPDDFIDYVKRYRSIKKEIGHVAKPEVVFYMRLMIVDWEIYIQKILRDIRAGIPEEVLDDVIEISKNLDVKDKIKPRVKKTKKIINARLSRT